MPSFEYRSSIPVSSDQLYSYHLNPGALARLTPPWESMRLLGRDEGIWEGLERPMRLGLGPISLPWTALHRDFVPGRQFVDEQLHGPFQSWVHTHRFEDTSEPDVAELKDSIQYRFPLSLPLGFVLKGKLEQAFRYRHRQTARDMEVITRYSSPLTGHAPWRIGVTGAGGFVGSALCSLLRAAGHRVTALHRGIAEADSEKVIWWPEPDLQALEGFDAIVHLAGETVAQPWTAAARERIMFSRDEGTRRLCEALARLSHPPKVLISTSASGYYQQQSEHPALESDPPGEGFLSEVCRAWESSTQVASEAGIRVCIVRVGLVLSPAGGLLAPQLRAFKLGLGAVLGDGRQKLPIIDRDDLVAAIYHLMHREDLQGPFNAAAPSQPSQREFAQELASACSRPLFLTVPEPPVRALLGEQADMFFRGVETPPARLLESGFKFLANDLKESLRHQMSLP